MNIVQSASEKRSVCGGRRRRAAVGCLDYSALGSAALPGH